MDPYALTHISPWRREKSPFYIQGTLYASESKLWQETSMHYSWEHDHYLLLLVKPLWDIFWDRGFETDLYNLHCPTCMILTCYSVRIWYENLQNVNHLGVRVEVSPGKLQGFFIRLFLIWLDTKQKACWMRLKIAPPNSYPLPMCLMAKIES